MNFIVDKAMPDAMRGSLLKFGNVFKSAYAALPHTALSTHPDLQIHFLNDTLAVCAPEVYDHYKITLPKEIKLLKGKAALSGTYPGDCAYNIARVGKNIICNTKYTDKTILDMYRAMNYQIIHVNQGYTKCSICPVTDEIILTEDKGIAKTLAEKTEIKVHLLSTNSALLNGFNCGFIGGASGKYGNAVLFCGKINDEISSILNELNVKFIQLSNDALYDYGSILSFG